MTLSLGVAFMGLSLTIDNGPQVALIKPTLFAEESKVYAFYQDSIWINNLKRFLQPSALLKKVYLSVLSLKGMVGFCPPMAIFQKTFFQSVLNVVFLSAKEKMVWPNAGFVVAMMADKKSLIKRAVSKFIGNPVSGDSGMSSNLHDAIAGLHLVGGPPPTTICLLDSAPKSGFVEINMHGPYKHIGDTLVNHKCRSYR